jgi:hypothetical protein
MPTTKLLLVIGEQLEVEGSVEEVVKGLENAARSSQGTFAWLKDAATQEPLCVSPAHVVTATPGED